MYEKIRDIGQCIVFCMAMAVLTMLCGVIIIGCYRIIHVLLFEVGTKICS